MHLNSSATDAINRFLADLTSNESKDLKLLADSISDNLFKEKSKVNYKDIRDNLNEALKNIDSLDDSKIEVFSIFYDSLEIFMEKNQKGEMAHDLANHAEKIRSDLFHLLATNNIVYLLPNRQGFQLVKKLLKSPNNNLRYAIPSVLFHLKENTRSMILKKDIIALLEKFVKDDKDEIVRNEARIYLSDD